MIQDKDKYEWSEDNATKNAKEKPAVYELYEKNGLIYIGSTGDLRERFTKYWNSKFNDDSCKQSTTSYKREYVSTKEDAEKKESAYLKAYKDKFGKLPRCNDKIP